MAERVWKLEKINRQYEKFIKETENKKLTEGEAIFRYLAILHQDPQLPLDLLPSDWQMETAHKIYKKLVFRDLLTRTLKKTKIERISKKLRKKN